ncbi:MAG: hypothetical protein CMJ70_12020 [Planctomycetaceae bacterium]|nr:hypothetical protein [Planctomycetaceae bacterium]
MLVPRVLATRQFSLPGESVQAGNPVRDTGSVASPCVEQTANDQVSVHRERMRLPGSPLLANSEQCGQTR